MEAEKNTVKRMLSCGTRKSCAEKERPKANQEPGERRGKKLEGNPEENCPGEECRHL